MGESPPADPEHLREAAEAALARYEEHGDIADLDRAVAHWEALYAVADAGAVPLADRLSAYNDGALDYLSRFDALGRVRDARRAVAVMRRAVAQSPAGWPTRALYLDTLGLALGALFRRTGRRRDIDEAVERHAAAVGLVPPADPEWAGHANNLAVALRVRYAHFGRPADLSRGIRICRRLVRVAPPGAPERAIYWHNLAIGLGARYERTGRRWALALALRAALRAVALASPEDPGRATRLNTLASLRWQRYSARGVISELELAITLWEGALALTPPSSPQRASYLNNLAVGLSERHLNSRDPGALAAAIAAWEAAVAAVEPGSPDGPDLLDNLGVGLAERHTLTGDDADLRRAIACHEAAVTHAPADHPARARYLNNLGTALRRAGQRARDAALLARAAAAHLAAAELERGPDAARFRANLAGVLRERYALSGDGADIDAAIAAYAAAIAGAARALSSLPAFLDGLAAAHVARHARTGDPRDLRAAIAAWERAYADLQAAFAIIPVGAKLAQQHQWASLAGRLAAAHASLAAAEPDGGLAARRRAMEIAEGAKSRLVVAGARRGDPSAPGESVAADLDAALAALDALELATHDRPVPTFGGRDRVEQLARRSELQRAQARRAGAGGAPGRPALAAPTWAELRAVAERCGPDTALLSLCVADERTLLCVLRAGWEAPRVIDAALPASAWGDAARRLAREVRGRRPETWDSALRGPLAEAGRHLAGAARVAVAPAGVAHQLPWSLLADRAGWRGPGGDPPVVVTLPALSLLGGRGGAAGVAGGEVVVVGDPAGDLPHARREAQEVADLFGVSPLLGGAATRAAILPRLGDAGRIHLATHGAYLGAAPLEAGVLLADGPLTIREILGLRLRADLLVLSACESGIVGSLGGEEMLGVAQAFLFAGVRSVVMSLWRVEDAATAALMRRFHDACLSGRARDVALGEATAAVRGRPGWAHAYYWAGFALVGDWSPGAMQPR